MSCLLFDNQTYGASTFEQFHVHTLSKHINQQIVAIKFWLRLKKEWSCLVYI